MTRMRARVSDSGKSGKSRRLSPSSRDRLLRSTMTDSSSRREGRCDECRSTYFADTSKMAALCPECAHVLYGYPACPHEMKGASAGAPRCALCGWDGSRSAYVSSIASKR
jgi:hypothetical protein